MQSVVHVFQKVIGMGTPINVQFISVMYDGSDVMPFTLTLTCVMPRKIGRTDTQIGFFTRKHLSEI